MINVEAKITKPKCVNRFRLNLSQTEDGHVFFLEQSIYTDSLDL